ncbi:hypothetical protein [Elizabethkingia ursingii]
MLAVMLVAEMPNAKEVMDSIFSNGNLQNITRGVQGIAGLALIWFFGKEISKILTGAEQFNPRVFGEPIIYALIVFNWQFLNNQLDQGLKAFSDQFENSIPKEAKGFNKYAEIDKNFKAMAAQKEKTKQSNSVIGAVTEAVGLDPETIENVKDIATNILNPELILMKIVSFLSAIIDACVMFLFNAFSYLWINMLRIGGTLAITLYMLPPFKQSLSNWLKTYISVYLWVPAGALVLYVCDSIFVKFMTSVQTSSMAAANGNFTLEQLATSNAMVLVIGIIVCLGLKIILLSKVPTLISYWVGGQSGGVFSSVSAMPTMMANAGKSVAGSAVQAGMIAGTGGAGAGAAAASSAGGSLNQNK